MLELPCIRKLFMHENLIFLFSVLFVYPGLHILGIPWLHCLYILHLSALTHDDDYFGDGFKSRTLFQGIRAFGCLL